MYMNMYIYIHIYIKICIYIYIAKVACPGPLSSDEPEGS